jgi:uncharacterized protein YqhQ
MSELLIGGQAVMEGVMMKSPNYISVAVMNNKKKIVSKTEKLARKKKWMKLPFIRGFINLGEIMIIGIKSLMWSAEQAAPEEEKITNKELALTIVCAIFFALVLFLGVPLFLTNLITSEANFIFNLIEGIIRIIVFISYLWFISLFKDVKRLFQYHGAEHCAVHCFESKKKLTVKNAKKFSTIHPRCGTSFVIIVLVISILVFTLIPSSNVMIKLLGRILLIPVITGISYEILKLTARFKSHALMHIIAYPGMLVQRITTRRPTDAQINIALLALKKVLKKEKINYL